jgi:hypothetical protein
VIAQGLHVQSRPIAFAEYEIELVIKGRLDSHIRAVESAETLVVDYKTATREELPNALAGRLPALAELPNALGFQDAARVLDSQLGYSILSSA